MSQAARSSSLTTDVARKRLWASLITSLRIYHPAREWMRYSYESFGENPYQPRVAQKVVGLAFLSAVAAWEQFVEHSSSDTWQERRRVLVTLRPFG
jgi:hypothetical protein